MLVTAEGEAEALALATRNGVDPRLAQQAMMNGIASSRVLDRLARVRQRNPGSSLSKDLQIVLDLASDPGLPLPVGDVEW